MFAVMDFLKYLGNRGAGGGTGRVRYGADNNEIVVHDVSAIDAIPIGNEFVFSLTRMYQHDIDVAFTSEAQRFAGADCDQMYFKACDRGESR